MSMRRSRYAAGVMIGATALLVAVALNNSFAASKDSAATVAATCREERWPVKTLSDPREKYRVAARLVEMKLEDDHDVHLVIAVPSAPSKTMIVEFPDADSVKRWYASPEYAEALKVRRTALERRLIFVEGVAV